MFALTYALRNLRRNKLRSGVTLVGVATLLLLVSLLMAVVSGLASAKEPDPDARRLIVRHEVSLTINLPEAYWERIRGVPHVLEVSPSSWFGGVYVDPKNFFARFFVDPETFLSMASRRQVDLPPDQAAAWIADRQGCIVVDSLAKQYGWKLGDRIVIKGDIYPVDVELNVRGIFTGEASALYFQRDYVEEALDRPGRVGTFAVEVDEPANLAGVAKAIDALFANSDAPTKSETEAAFTAGFVSMQGDVEGLLKRLSLIIIVTVLLTAGNTMAMAVRERTAEVAILKAIGFLPGRIVGLIVTESTLLGAMAGLVGIGGFWLFTWLVFVKGGVNIPMLWFAPTLSTPMGLGLLAGSVLLGAIAGVAPALFAARRHVVDGLRRN
jgi:putative ABC transport system permease protein